jgi:hypothetical protein
VGRIRTIKPELFLDEALGALSGDHLALFVGLWTIADREGRLAWRPARIKATLFPYRKVDVEALAATLDEIGKVQLYEVDGERYLWVCGFVRHQRPHPKEPASDLPPAPSREKKRPAVERQTAIPSSPVGREGKGREKVREGILRAADAAPPEGETPEYKATVAALFTVFREDRGRDPQPDGKNWNALKRLRAKHSDTEIIRRWGNGVPAKYKRRTSSFVDLEAKWDECGDAEPAQTGPARKPGYDPNQGIITREVERETAAEIEEANRRSEAFFNGE